MRALFANTVYEKMKINKDIFVLVGDLGYGIWDKVRDDFSDRFINCGASEQAMMDIAIGIALAKKIPIVYSITPFLLFRTCESIRTYINHEKIPVKMIGSGRGKDYEILGFSHWAEDDRDFMKLFPNIISYWPNKEDIITYTKKMIYDNRPYYINLSKS